MTCTKWVRGKSIEGGGSFHFMFEVDHCDGMKARRKGLVQMASYVHSDLGHAPETNLFVCTTNIIIMIIIISFFFASTTFFLLSFFRAGNVNMCCGVLRT